MPVPVPSVVDVNRAGVAPLQMVCAVPIVPAVTAAFTVTVALAQVVVLQAPDVHRMRNPPTLHQ